MKRCTCGHAVYYHRAPDWKQRALLFPLAQYPMPLGKEHRYIRHQLRCVHEGCACEGFREIEPTDTCACGHRRARHRWRRSKRQLLCVNPNCACTGYADARQKTLGL